MKYRVSIPAPKAKRMTANAKLVVILHDGWEGDQLVQVELERKESPLTEFGDVEFEVPDRYEWTHSTSVVDGWSFDVQAEFQNSTGTRKEVIRLVPEKVKCSGE
jgi:hypothetical protein